MNIIEFSNITLKDLPEVGGKNSSSGEMFNKLRGAGVRVPDGFVVTASAYRQFLKHNQLESKLKNLLDQVNINNLTTLAEIGSRCRQLVLQGEIPELLTKEILTHFKTLKSKYGEKISVAVRSSGTAEDLPNASFAGQHNSFLNV
ncbi:MAG: PEP/pyruvate-binding domain-containing protein, partial [Bacteroidia bacterium]